MVNESTYTVAWTLVAECQTFEHLSQTKSLCCTILQASDFLAEVACCIHRNQSSCYLVLCAYGMTQGCTRFIYFFREVYPHVVWRNIRRNKAKTPWNCVARGIEHSLMQLMFSALVYGLLENSWKMPFPNCAQKYLMAICFKFTSSSSITTTVR